MYPAERLTDMECNMLIAWFTHHMGMDERVRLMRTMPEIYNKLVGREVVKVVYAEDSNDIR
jgi:hypothetical protein